jgi:hypothetical protein
MKGYRPNTMPFLSVSIDKMDGQVQISDINNFGLFKILPDKLFLPIFPHLLTD